jgi:ribosomal protein S18 acetylase RimI-like enzyme
MMSGLSIERLRPDHCASISRLLEDNDREEITCHFHPFPMTRETAERLCIPCSKDRYYAAFQGCSAVGLAMLRGWEEGYDIPSFGMFTDYRHHGRGIGRQLIEFTIREAERLGCTMVRLTIYESNLRGRRLYVSLGFQEQSREPVERCGARDNRIVMVRPLTA